MYLNRQNNCYDEELHMLTGETKWGEGLNTGL